VRLTVHSLLITRGSIRPCSIASLTASICELMIMCKILLVIPTGVVKHGTLPTILVMTYLIEV